MIKKSKSTIDQRLIRVMRK